MGLNIAFLLGGIGIFVFGIQLLEKALRALMSRRFKLLLMRMTNKPLRAIFGGTVITALLQSSSVVNFLVLAFAGSGVIALRNALAVIMGTNLGTTVNSWIVATLGFRVDIEAYALPVAGVAGLVLFVGGERNRLQTIARFLLGFSFLFIGLSFMKDSVEGEALRGTMASFVQYPPIVFLLFGVLATTITQSSAATVAITLSLLYQQVVGLDDAMAIVIGSEVGTSLKLLLGALDRVPIKQRIATGNFVYNLITTIVAFVLLYPAQTLITDIIGVRDPLLALATFQSAMNVMSILLFFPFLNPLSAFLESKFTQEPSIAALVLTHHTPADPEAGVELLHKESGFFINQCLVFNALNFHVSVHDLQQPADFAQINLDRNTFGRSFDERYALIKEHYGEIQSYYIRLRAQAMSHENVEEADNLIASVRSAMHAAKCTKDIHPDMHVMRHSIEQHNYDFLQHMQHDVAGLYKQLDVARWSSLDRSVVAEELKQLLQVVQKHYQENMQTIYTMASAHKISDVELATMMNFNRELFTGSKAMIMSLKNYLLTTALADTFNEIPTYLP